MTKTRKGVEPVVPFRVRLERYFAETDILATRAELGTTESKRSKRSGRRKGDGAYNDMPYLEKMLALVQQGQCKSIKEAASQFVDEVKGASRDAKIERLRRKFRKMYPNWREGRLDPFKPI